jgi:hypothetical protein
LLVVGEEDCRAVARADIVALSVSGRRIMDLKEELKQLTVTGLGWIKSDFDGLGMIAVVAVGRVGTSPNS